MKLKLTIITILCCIIQVQAQEFSSQVERFINVDDAEFAITNVTVIDGTGNTAKINQTIVVSEGNIIALGNKSEVNLPPNAKIIDGTSKTIVPGLVMLHEHMFYTMPFENWFSVGQMTFTFPRLYLAGGVTSMRTGGSIQPQTDLNVQKWINEGKMTGPKMHVTGPFIEREGPKVPELGFIGNTDEVAKIVNYWADKGVTSFKVYNNITKEDLKICVEEAHKRGLKVTGHLCSLTYEEASNIGIDNLEHGFMAASDFAENKEENICDPFTARQGLTNEPEDGDKINRLIDLLIKNKTAITTTPNVFEPYTDREIAPGGGLEALAPQIQERLKASYERSQGKDAGTLARFNKNLTWIKRFYDKGGILVAGTDPTGAGRTVAGYSNQRTVEILVEAGFTVEEAIKVCTLNGAKFLEQDKLIGTLEVGKKADILLINGNLKTNIKNIRNMEIVFKDGIGFDSQKLFESVKGQVGLN
ncbi:amidohydrolase family protein [Flavobacteriaceae bacterium S0825]|uniref:amidohydrolase family protein n=1 Tax=Gaetbulibacter sp. S0825 TaxID=2720084 RepID=UPI0014304E47|nr:amidohydrolase family protein [Gaetbulibacter sp. S0825]MCK0110379.1 amidohydrolase family protein [Flavobacteriaceae bacterium S0825]NIX66008.1 amidohydrolase family protein [Gaetbulibacter sp. S0825]